MKISKKWTLLLTTFLLICLLILLDWFRLTSESTMSGVIKDMDAYCKQVIRTHNIRRLKFYDPDKFKTYYWLGYCYQRDEQYEKAILHYKKAMKYPPIITGSDKNVHLGLTQCYRALDQTQ